MIVLCFFLDNLLPSIFLFLSVRNSLILGLLDWSYTVLIYSLLFLNSLPLVSFFTFSLLGDCHDFIFQSFYWIFFSLFKNFLELFFVLSFLKIAFCFCFLCEDSFLSFFFFFWNYSSLLQSFFHACLSLVILACSFIFKNERLEKLSKSFEYIGRACQLAELSGH